jgi:hypothetical protein
MCLVLFFSFIGLPKMNINFLQSQYIVYQFQCAAMPHLPQKGTMHVLLWESWKKERIRLLSRFSRLLMTSLGNRQASVSTMFF